MSWDNEEFVNCTHCKHHRDNPCTRRIDHDRVRLYHPSFKTCYDYWLGGKVACSDFEPDTWCKYVYEHWEDFQTYCKGYAETWGRHKMFYDGLIWVYINGHLWDSFDAPMYGVDAREMVFGHPFDAETGHLKAIKKKYCVRCRKTDEHPLGYYIVTEDIDGVNVYEEEHKI